MNDDNNHEDEKKDEVPPLLSTEDLLWAWRCLAPLCVVVYLYITFTTPSAVMKLIAAFLTLFFAASTSMAWRTEPRQPRQEK